MKSIDAKNITYSNLNKLIKQYFKSGIKEILLKNVNGQRYIGDGITGNQKLKIHGIPGNDMAAYMNGLKIIVNSNVQDAVANTMNAGKIIIHGNTGDALGYGMRGGEVYVKGSVGYRVGIHMKEYKEKVPIIVIGEKAGDFLGEYMAGGIIILLGLNLEYDEEIVGNYCGTGMHGGVMYIRGCFESNKLGKEVKLVETDEKDVDIIKKHVKIFADYFNYDYENIMNKNFSKLIPYNKRPYGKLYAY